MLYNRDKGGGSKVFIDWIIVTKVGGVMKGIATLRFTPLRMMIKIPRGRE